MRRKAILGAAMAGAAFLLAGCDKLRESGPGSESAVKNSAYPERVYWGDTHLHTSNSVDAFGFGNRLDPEAALRFARGEEVTSSTGTKAKLARPLDFLVITDHAEGLGATKALYDAPRMLISDPTLLRWYDLMHKGPAGSLQATREMLDARAHNALPAGLNDPAAAEKRTRKIWSEYLDTVESYNEPGKFTAFMGFEYTLMQGGNNLHRNLIFRDGKDRVGTIVPLDPTNDKWPEDRLFDYMDAYEKTTGGKVLSIPHNANLSNGLMFMLTEPGGGPMSAETARRKIAHEPLVEITQIKGDSEAHPFLSPNDEFAGYGTAGWDTNNLLGTQPTQPGDFAGSYVREALKRGLLVEQRTGVNPYKFGVLGSTDAHTSLSTADDNNYFGKHTGVEPSPTRASSAQNLGTGGNRFGWHYLASGYAAVWATSNTRAAIWDAMMRREVYGTTGPRMTVRFFGGWDFKPGDLAGDWVKAGYARGVPMGGTLAAHKRGAPSFIVSALKDPVDGNLDRVQVVKGWVDKAGAAHEKVFDVVWSDMDRRKPAGGKVPAVGDSVDTATATFTNTIGAPALAAVWSDPEFDRAQRAFYYVRVLMIPTPSWVDYDMVRYHLTLGPEIPLKQQERAYSSAIWYTPS